MSLYQSENNYKFYQRDTTSQETASTSSGGKISPAILFTIIILAVIFFICGLLHLLVRFVMRQRSSVSQSSRYSDNVSNSDTVQRQLQQLFHLHDSGLDQAFIDALPVFQYKEIVGLNEPFDCAVCLCEFNDCDKLRLLPLCSHAFHIDCIDKWLLSNSTCPLCRGTLYTPGMGFENPVFDFEDFRECDGKGRKSFEVEIVGEKRVFPVRLGKFRSTNNEVSERGVVDVGETSSSSFDVRRCYSMGSYEYVVNDSVLEVALCPSTKPSIAQARNSITTTTISNADAEARKITIGSKKESLSVSKIWLWSKKGRYSNSSNNEFNGVDMSLPWTSKGLAS